MTKLHRVAAALMVTPLFALANLGAASAHAIAVQEDRTDNEVTFTYQAGSGDMPSQRTASRSSSDDDVQFKVLVREAEDAGSGLIGKLKLRLDGDHRTIYDGWFTFRVVAADGEVAFQRSRPANIRLSPQPGMRRAALTFRFDLPSGTYEATGSFENGR